MNGGVWRRRESLFMPIPVVSNAVAADRLTLSVFIIRESPGMGDAVCSESAVVYILSVLRHGLPQATDIPPCINSMPDRMAK